MSSRWITRTLFVTGALALSLSGCGGGNATPDNAVALPDPAVKVGASAPAATSTTTPVATTTSSDASKPAASTTPIKADGWGTLKGKITFEGAAPAQPDLVTKGDANAKDSGVCAKATIKSEKLVVDGASKGVKNVLVYIAKPTAVNPEAKSSMSQKTVVFDQKNCVFEPHVMAIMVGEKVDLKSTDPVPHNINSKVDNNVLNQAMAANASAPFSAIAPARQPGLVVCDIHPWMSAYWMVLDHPYYAVTNDKGEFEIKNVPAGTQKVVVWQESTRFVTPASGKEVNVAAGGSTDADFTIQSSQVK